MRLDQKVAVVTGSSSGIGRATAELFAREGAQMVVTGRTNLSTGEDVATAIRAAGGDAIFQQLDVADEESVRELVATTIAQFGRIDILFNNAAPMYLLREKDRSVGDLAEQVWDEMIDVTLKGTYLCSKHVVPIMAEHGGGSIINNGSVDAIVACVGSDAYTAAKGGVLALTISMAATYAASGIRVNCISPGVVDRADISRSESERRQLESLHLLGLGRPEDIAFLALYLASDEARWMTGSNIVLDGGYSVRKRDPVDVWLNGLE